MASNPYGRLHGIFSSGGGNGGTTAVNSSGIALKTKRTRKPKPTIAAVDTTVNSPPKNPRAKVRPLPIVHLTDSLNKLKLFINRFKGASDTGTFRFSTKYYESVVTHLARARQFSYIEEILEYQKRYETDIIKESFVVRLITLYGKAGMFDNARKLFDEMPQLKAPRTAMSLSALLSACINSKRYEEVPALLIELTDKLSIEPDTITYNTVIKSFCKRGLISEALLVLDQMERTSNEPNVVTFNTLLNGCCEHGKFSDAEEIWSLMKAKNVVPDVRSYNEKIRGLVSEKRTMEAVNMIEEMKSKGLKPDAYTYNALIHGFVKDDNLGEVKNWYHEIAKDGIVPDRVTFMIAVPFACDKGDFYFAFELCKAVLGLKHDVGRLNLQRVVDGLVKVLGLDEAKELVEMVNSMDHLSYQLKSPEDD